MNDAESFFVCHLDVVPVGRDPGGILILPFHDEATARGFETPLSCRSADELLAATGRYGRLEQHFLPLLVPEPMVGHADDEVGLVGGGSRGLVEQRPQAVSR